jgi:hypothetical protein
VTESYGTLCSIEDVTGNVRQATSPESGNRMSKIVIISRSPIPLKSSTKIFQNSPIYIYWCDVATPYIDRHKRKRLFSGY